MSMLQIDNTIVSLDLFDECFVCDLATCKGICCVEGDAGAPLEADEVEILEREYPNYRPYMTPEGIEAVERSRGMKYVLLNLPHEKIDEAIRILPGMKSPTILPLAQEGWCSIHVVVREDELWSKIEQLKEIGAEDILVLALEKTVW